MAGIFGISESAIYRPEGSLPARRGQTIPQYTSEDFKNSDGFRLVKPYIDDPYIREIEAYKSKVRVYESGIYWEFPDVPFRAIDNYYLKDPGIQSAVNTYVNDIIGSGFYFTSDDQAVVDFLNEWNIDSNFENKLKICIGDAVRLGCSLAEIVRSGTYFDIVPVDMRTIVAVKRDKLGNVEHYIQQTQTSTFTNLEPKNFIKFSNIDVGRRAWPIGIFHSLVVPFFEFEGESWCLADVMSLTRQDYARIIHKMAAPRVWHIYENANEEKLKAQALRDKTMKAGERGYANQEFKILYEQLDGNTRFVQQLEFLSNQFENGLQAPTAKLMTAAGISNATYASADAAREMFEKHILSNQRKWKMQVEQQILKILLSLNNYDLAKSKTQFNWGMPDPPEVDVNQILALVGAGVMQIPEAREILKNYARLPLSAEYTESPQPEEEDEDSKQERIKKQQRTKSAEQLKAEFYIEAKKKLREI